MASRRLALNLTKGLRSRASLTKSVPWARGFATPVTSSALGKVQTTTLKNGLTVRPNMTRLNWPLRPSPTASFLTMGLDRSLPTTRRGRRPPPSACGLMPAPGPRPTRPTAPLTSSSISPSRYRRLPPATRTTARTSSPTHTYDEPDREPPTGRSSSSSSGLRTWAATSTPTPRFVMDHPTAPRPLTR